MGTLRKRQIGNDPRNVRWDAIIEVATAEKRSRRVKTFLTQKDAKDYLATVRGRQPALTATFEVLKDHFVTYFERLVETGNREASTLKQLREHINLHILPDTELSGRKCSDITTEIAQCFLDRLTLRVSGAMTIKVRATLSQIFSFGARRGYMTSNPVRETRLDVTTRPSVEDAVERFFLPPKADLSALLETARGFDNTGRAEALVRIFMYAGLRASEGRGLTWSDLKLDGELTKIAVNRKADLAGKIGKVKSRASKREVEIGPNTVAVLQRWREAASNGEFVFSNEAGMPISYSNLWNRFWVPLMNQAGLVTEVDASQAVRAWSSGQKSYKAPRFGFHMLRHVYASLQIERGVSPKRLQKLMGHATLKLTMDTYGHLWPDDEADRARASAVERLLG